MALRVKVGLIGPLDMLKFKNMSKVREEYIQKAPAYDVTANFPINNNAKILHPDSQQLVISEIIDHAGTGAETFVFTNKSGGPLAYFRAGQYLSLQMQIGPSLITRPFSISSSPKEALAGKVAITIKSNPDGFAADYMLNHLNVGDEITASGPQGTFYYEELRDAPDVVALADGSGITPFLSMAKAIADGTEDFRLTILFGSRTEEQILFRRELDELAAACDKIKIIHVLSDEWKDGFEKGFITAKMIQRYAPERYSLFICGPEAMYRFLESELPELGLERKYIRRELMGVTKDITQNPGFPADAAGKTFTITVRRGTKEYTIPAAATEPILVAFERAGIAAPSHCRSGECGWCRSKVISGECFAPEENEARRYADRVSGYIHPCATFPLSDMVIEVY